MAKDKPPKLQDKGVHCPTDSSLSFSKDEDDKAMKKIKKDVKAVIELMGPNTPHFDQNFSLSEESIFPNTTTTQSIKENKAEEDPNCPTENDFSTIPPDAGVQDTDFSLIVDDPSSYRQQQCVCPPPLYPAHNYVYNSECMCPQMVDYMKHNEAFKKPKSEKVKLLQSLYNIFKDKKNDWSKKGEYYTINVKQSADYGLPRRLVFDLVDEVPKESAQNLSDNGICKCCCLKKESSHPTYQKDSKNIRVDDIKHGIINENMLPVDRDINLWCKNNKFNQKTTYMDCNGATRVDVYYFDHGCSNYFRTTDKSPILATEALAERTEAYTTKFWAELFGTFNIGFSFLTSFVLQFLRFILYTIVRPLTVGILQLTSDYFLKPLLCAIFNAVIQPILIFLYNIASSVRDFCDPVAEAVGFFIRELSTPIRAFRIVEVRKEIRENVPSKQGYKRVFRKNNPVI